MRRFLIAYALVISLAGCAGALTALGAFSNARDLFGAIGQAKTTADRIEAACKVVAWGVGFPESQGYVSLLNPTEQSIVADAKQAAIDCGNGNGSDAVIEVAKGLVAVLWNPKHVMPPK